MPGNVELNQFVSYTWAVQALDNRAYLIVSFRPWGLTKFWAKNGNYPLRSFAHSVFFDAVGLEIF